MINQDTEQEQESKSNENLESNAKESSYLKHDSDERNKKNVFSQSSSLENSPLLHDEIKQTTKTVLPSFQNVSNMSSISKTISTICQQRIPRISNTNKLSNDPYLYHDVESNWESDDEKDERVETTKSFLSKSAINDTSLNTNYEYSKDTKEDDMMRYIQNEEARDKITPDQIILNAVDRIEDETDPYNYLPFRFQYFLETYVFGWSHLFSDILGHILIPLAASIIVSYLFCLTFIKWDFIGQMIKWWNHIRGVVVFSNGSFAEKHDFTFKVIRFYISFSTAVWAYRGIRRRRDIWLRTNYGSKEYEADISHRSLEVDEVDRTTLLGRIRRGVAHSRDKMLASRVHKKIKKATTRFQTKQLKLHRERSKKNGMFPGYVVQRRKGLSGIVYQTVPPMEKDNSVMRSVAEDQIFLSELIQNIPYAHGGYFGAAPFMLADPLWVNILRTLMPDVYVEVAKRIFSPIPKLIHWAENNPVVCAYGTVQDLNWKKTSGNAVTCLEWDVFLDPSLVARLEIVLHERDHLLKQIHWPYYSPFENKAEIWLQQNEYQTQMASHIKVIDHHDSEIRSRTQNLIEKMLIAHGNTTQLMLEQTGFLKKYIFSRVKRTRRTLGGGIFARQWFSAYVEALKLGIEGDTSKSSKSSESLDEKNERKDFDSNDSLDQLTYPESSNEESTCDSSDNAHVNMKNENLVVQLNEDAFAPSSKEHTVLFKHRTTNSGIHHDSNENQQSTSLDALAISSFPDRSIPESIQMLNSVMSSSSNYPNHCQIGLVLDLKSRHVSKRIWALVIDALRHYGVRVDGLGSFAPEDIRNTSTYTCEPVPELFFFHSAGDLQDACHKKIIHKGDIVYFNAGSLLWDKYDATFCESVDVLKDRCFGDFDMEETKAKYQLQSYALCDSNKTTSTIQLYQQYYDLRIGLYCQEFAIDDGAIDLLIRFVNRNSDVYKMGFCWGGVNGVTVAGIQPGRFTSTDGLWNQRYLGKKWNSSLWPGDDVIVNDDDSTEVATDLNDESKIL